MSSRNQKLKKKAAKRSNKTTKIGLEKPKIKLSPPIRSSVDDPVNDVFDDEIYEDEIYEDENKIPEEMPLEIEKKLESFEKPW